MPTTQQRETIDPIAYEAENSIEAAWKASVCLSKHADKSPLGMALLTMMLACKEIARREPPRDCFVDHRTLKALASCDTCGDIFAARRAFILASQFYHDELAEAQRKKPLFREEHRIAIINSMKQLRNVIDVPVCEGDTKAGSIAALLNDVFSEDDPHFDGLGWMLATINAVRKPKPAPDQPHADT